MYVADQKLGCDRACSILSWLRAPTHLKLCTCVCMHLLKAGVLSFFCQIIRFTSYGRLLLEVVDVICRIVCQKTNVHAHIFDTSFTARAQFLRQKMPLAFGRRRDVKSIYSCTDKKNGRRPVDLQKQ